MTSIIRYTSKVSTLTSETYHYNRGVSQMFSQPTHLFNPTEYPEEDLLYNSEREMLPIAIYCVVEEGIIPLRYLNYDYIDCYFIIYRCATIAYNSVCC